jgi:predicted DNA-binding transcriptional regulator YafY
MSRGNYKKSTLKKSKLQLELRGIEFVNLVDVAKKFNVNVRTLTRYKDEMIAEGIKVEKKPGKNHLYRIYDAEQSSLPKFTEDEFNKLTNELKYLAGIDESISSKLLKIIYLNLEDLGDYKNEIEIIRKSIKTKTKIFIKKYYGRERVSYDRILTVAKIDIPRKKIFAYDEEKEEDKKNKKDEKRLLTFNLENMEKVSALDKPADKFPPYEPKAEDLDVFGFNFYGKKIKVELLLTMFAKSQLVRQFPIMEKHLILIKKDPYYAILKITVHDIQPIARFVTGLFNEIRIEGSEQAKEEIKTYYFNRVDKGYQENYS